MLMSWCDHACVLGVGKHATSQGTLTSINGQSTLLMPEPWLSPISKLRARFQTLPQKHNA